MRPTARLTRDEQARDGERPRAPRSRRPPATGADHRGEPSEQDTGGGDGRDVLADHLGDLALALQGERDLGSTLEGIVRAAVGTVPGAEHASVSRFVGRDHVESLAATSDVARAIDLAQHETGEGPCLDSLFEQRTVRVGDLATERRWPRWAARALALDVGSMLAVQLYVNGEDLGSLNLSSGRAGAFDDDSEHVALLFAPHASVALMGAHRHEQMTSAMNRRDLIGQAKGILMERYRITGDQAFDVLVQASQRTNRKLHEVADELVTAGSMPG